MVNECFVLAPFTNYLRFPLNCCKSISHFFGEMSYASSTIRPYSLILAKWNWIGQPNSRKYAFVVVFAVPRWKFINSVWRQPQRKWQLSLLFCRRLAKINFTSYFYSLLSLSAGKQSILETHKCQRNTTTHIDTVVSMTITHTAVQRAPCTPRSTPTKVIILNG